MAAFIFVGVSTINDMTSEVMSVVLSIQKVSQLEK